MGRIARRPGDRDKFQAYLDNYARSQKAAGRLPRKLNNQLYDVASGSTSTRSSQKDNRVLIGIAMLFLAVCLVNVVGLLLAKFMNGAALTGLRRALGASRRDIVRQHLTEVLLIGLAGGVLGPAAGDRRSCRDPLAVHRRRYESEAQVYDQLTNIDFTVVLVTLGLALLAGLLAGLYPAWRIGRTAPAIYLKSQ